MYILLQLDLRRSSATRETLDPPHLEELTRLTIVDECVWTTTTILPHSCFTKNAYIYCSSARRQPICECVMNYVGKWVQFIKIKIHSCIWTLFIIMFLFLTTNIRIFLVVDSFTTCFTSHDCHLINLRYTRICISLRVTHCVTHCVRSSPDEVNKTHLSILYRC